MPGRNFHTIDSLQHCCLASPCETGVLSSTHSDSPRPPLPSHTYDDVHPRGSALSLKGSLIVSGLCVRHYTSGHTYSSTSLHPFSSNFNLRVWTFTIIRQFVETNSGWHTPTTSGFTAPSRYTVTTFYFYRCECFLPFMSCFPLRIENKICVFFILNFIGQYSS